MKHIITPRIVAGVRRAAVSRRFSERSHAPRTITAGVMVTAMLLLAPMAQAVEPMPMASLAPADGAAFYPTANGNGEFGLTGGPLHSFGAQHIPASLTIRVSRSPALGSDGVTLSDLSQVDVISLSASMTDPGIYRGGSLVGATAWANVPGTYYWQVTGSWLVTTQDDPTTPTYDATSVWHYGYGPVRRIVVAPQTSTQFPQTQTSSAIILTMADARSEARYYLADHSASYVRGARRSVTCSRLSSRNASCRARWRFRGRTYAARMRLRLEDNDEVKFSPVSIRPQ